MAKKLERGARKPETDQKTEAQPSESLRDQQPSTSQDSSEQPLPPELEERLGARIAEEVERRFQSAKDKRWMKLERQFGALSEFQQSMPEPDSEPNPHSDGSKSDDWLARKTHDLLDATGLVNDPEVQAMFRRGEYGPDAEGYLDFLSDITKLALQRAGRPAATPATVAQPVGSGAPEPDLRSEYDLRKARLRPGDVNALMELKREFRQKGLDVF
jgi:hypothetical protein